MPSPCVLFRKTKTDAIRINTNFPNVQFLGVVRTLGTTVAREQFGRALSSPTSGDLLTGPASVNSTEDRVLQDLQVFNAGGSAAVVSVKASNNDVGSPPNAAWTVTLWSGTLQAGQRLHYSEDAAFSVV